MWWVVWLWVAVPQVPAGPAFYPPHESILLQSSGLVHLTWNRPGRVFVVRLWKGDTLVSQVTTTERRFPVSVENGGSYTWTVQTSSIRSRWRTGSSIILTVGPGSRLPVGVWPAPTAGS